MWDKPGDDEYFALAKTYFRDAKAVLISFSLNSKTSFESLAKHIKDVDNFGTPNMMKILLGTKSDLVQEREVSQKEGETLANNNGFHYFETSAKDGSNVHQVIQTIANHIYKIDFPKK